jgi:hypothetical protein
VEKKKWERLLAFIFAAVSFVVGIAGLSTLDKRVIAGVIVLSALLAVASAIYFLRSSKNPAFRELVSGIPASDEVTVRAVRNEFEIRAVSTLDEQYFGAESVDFAGLLAWWKRYPEGVHVLVKGSEIMGAVGIWPLSKKAFHDLISGNLDDAGIKATNLSRKADKKKRAYWYFADIVLAKKYKRKKLSFVLLQGAINRWLESGNLAPTLELCAIGVGDEGVPLLKKLGFISHVESRKGHPVFVRTATISEIENDLQVKIVVPQVEATGSLSLLSNT